MGTGSFCKIPVGRRDEGVVYSGLAGPPEAAARRVSTDANDQGRCVAFNFFDVTCPSAGGPSVIVMAARFDSTALTP